MLITLLQPTDGQPVTNEKKWHVRVDLVYLNQASQTGFLQ